MRPLPWSLAPPVWVFNGVAIRLVVDIDSPGLLARRLPPNPHPRPNGSDVRCPALKRSDAGRVRPGAAHMRLMSVQSQHNDDIRHHLDYEPLTGDSWCIECQIVFATRSHAEAHTEEPFLWVDTSCGNCGPCRATYGKQKA
jgi:hypothetical protein